MAFYTGSGHNRQPLRGVVKNGSICPHDICGSEKAAAAVVRRTLGLKRELVMSVG